MMRRHLDPFAVALMLILSLLWGMQQIAVKLAVPDMSPTLQLGLRSVAAALLVTALILWRHGRLSLQGRTLLPGIGAGVLFAAEFLCVARGLELTSASHMSVFLYTAPIFAVIGLHYLIPGERLRVWQWLGVLAAFSGIAVAFSQGLHTPSTDIARMLAGDALGVLGGLLWAATTLLIRRSSLSEASPAVTLLYQLGGCGIVLLSVALYAGEAENVQMTPVVWSSLLFQSVVVGFASYLLWFWMLRNYLASRLSVFSFMTPLFGVLLGVSVLDEPLDPYFVAGTALVLSGIVLVNMRFPARIS